MVEKGLRVVTENDIDDGEIVGVKSSVIRKA